MSTSIWISICCLAGIQAATILFDGRIPKGTQPSDFDDDLTPYKAEVVKGENQTWSEILATANMPSSLFDGDQFQSVEMTINDDSVFPPNPGFRRSDLRPILTADLNSGTVTFHFSVMNVVSSPLNESHQYELVYLESTTDRRHVFELRYGTNYTNSSTPPDLDPQVSNTLRIMNSSTEGFQQMVPLFQTDFTPDTFHNFAITVDFDKATFAVYYSQGFEPLQLVIPETANAVRTPAEMHYGMLKLPVGLSNNPALEGFQPTGIEEKLIYGGIFVEDSAFGVVTTESF